MTEEDVRAMLERQLVIQRYLKERFAPVAYADEEQARAEYDEHYVPEQEAAGLPVEPFESVAEEMRRRASERAFEEQVARWLKELRQKARIGIYRIPPALEIGRNARRSFRPRPFGHPRLESPRLRFRGAGVRRRRGAGGCDEGSASGSPCPCATACSCAPTCCRPAADGTVPDARLPHALRPAARVRGDEVVAGAPSPRGYAVVLQDVRGRYGSDGDFEPYRQRGPRRVRHDRVGGRPALVDRSRSARSACPIPGAVQWLAAVESPPHLKAMVPAMTFSTPRNFFYAGGVWDLSWIGLDLEQHRARRARARGPSGSAHGREARAAWKAHPEDACRPASADRRSTSSATWRPTTSTGCATRRGTPWWDWAELRGRYGRVGAAVLNLSGWHDEAYGPEGAMTNFLGPDWTRAAGDGRARADDPGPLDPRRRGLRKHRAGDRVFGPQARLDYPTRSSASWTATCAASTNGVDREPASARSSWARTSGAPATRCPLPGTQAARRCTSVRGGHGLLAGPKPSGGASVERRSSPTRAARSTIRTARIGRARLPRAGGARATSLVFETAPLDEAAARRGRDRNRDLPRRGREGRRPLGQALRRRPGRDGLQPFEPRDRRPARELPRRRSGRQDAGARRRVALRFPT